MHHRGRGFYIVLLAVFSLCVVKPGVRALETDDLTSTEFVWSGDEITSNDAVPRGLMLSLPGRPHFNFSAAAIEEKAELIFRLTEEQVLSFCGLNGACLLNRDGDFLPTSVRIEGEYVQYSAIISGPGNPCLSLEIDPATGAAGEKELAHAKTGSILRASGDVVRMTLDHEHHATVTTGPLGGPVTLSFSLQNEMESLLCGSEKSCVLKSHLTSILPAERLMKAGSLEYFVTVHLEPETVHVISLMADSATSLPPVAANDFTTTDEDEAVLISVLNNDSDPNGDPLQVVDFPSLPFKGTVEALSDGRVRYTPELDRTGFDRFEYRITDGEHLAKARVSIIINPRNDPPRVVDDRAHTQEERGVLIPVLANDRDPEFDPLTVISVGSSASGTPRLLQDGSVFFEPATDFFGQARFTYTVSDGQTTSTGEVLVTVDNVADAPIAIDDAFTTVVGQPIDLAVLANDVDPDQVSSMPTALVVSQVAQGTGGIVTLDTEEGTVAFQPAPGFVGDAFFSYRMRNESGLEDEAQVIVTVTAGNLPPIAVEDRATTNEDVAIEIDLVANDTDPEGADLEIVFVGPSASDTLRLLPDLRTVRFEPAADFFGTASFVYAVSDGETSSQATVAIEVLPLPDFPVAVDDVATVSSGNEVTILVLDNDRDPDGGILGISSTSVPGVGVVRILNGNALVYTAPLLYAGQDAFFYTTTNLSGESVTAEVVVTVEPASSGEAPP